VGPATWGRRVGEINLSLIAQEKRLEKRGTCRERMPHLASGGAVEHGLRGFKPLWFGGLRAAEKSDWREKVQRGRKIYLNDISTILPIRGIRNKALKALACLYSLARIWAAKWSARDPGPGRGR